MAVVDVTTLTEDELYELQVAVEQERGKRRFLATADESAKRFNADYLNAAGIVSGEAWTQPAGAHDAYPSGWQVTHNAKTWESLIDFNVWEPGVSGWSEVVPVGEFPAWVQPTGAHDAYALDAQVSHNGFVWTSLVVDNVWEPSDANSTLWAKGDPYP